MKLVVGEWYRDNTGNVYRVINSYTRDTSVYYQIDIVQNAEGPCIDYNTDVWLEEEHFQNERLLTDLEKALL